MLIMRRWCLTRLRVTSPSAVAFSSVREMMDGTFFSSSSQLEDEISSWVGCKTRPPWALGPVLRVAPGALAATWSHQSGLPRQRRVAPHPAAAFLSRRRLPTACQVSDAYNVDAAYLGIATAFPISEVRLLNSGRGRAGQRRRGGTFGSQKAKECFVAFRMRRIDTARSEAECDGSCKTGPSWALSPVILVATYPLVTTLLCQRSRSRHGSAVATWSGHLGTSRHAFYRAGPSRHVLGAIGSKPRPAPLSPFSPFLSSSSPFFSPSELLGSPAVLGSLGQGGDTPFMWRRSRGAWSEEEVAILM
ncbi:hypothetical protein Taro_029220 [Colocasia esculenta]|uniref:Uncharacterized protein n=1 Tax=Colocasia esculenta TaxID=4460 RepID=A0A843VIF8_COLES|nr:hypothetical protein [Colocasia esculenta]